MKEMHEKFIKDCRDEIEKLGEQDNHCIILYKCIGSFNEHKYVYKVYKNLDEYIKRGFEDIEKIESNYGIGMQVWYFD